MSARETGNSIKPGVQTPGTKREKRVKPVKTGDSRLKINAAIIHKFDLSHRFLNKKSAAVDYRRCENEIV